MNVEAYLIVLCKTTSRQIKSDLQIRLIKRHRKVLKPTYLAVVDRNALISEAYDTLVSRYDTDIHEIRIYPNSRAEGERKKSGGQQRTIKDVSRNAHLENR